MKFFKQALLLSAITLSLSSCFKQGYDNPPDVSHQDPNLPCNVNAGQLATMALQKGSGWFRTLGDSTIYGVVTADDRSGNLYKEIVIQDSTGGIAISIAQTDIYNDFPIGRKVYIKLNGLTLCNYHGLPEIVFSAVSSAGSVTTTGIPISLETNYIIGASFPNTVVPELTRLSDIQSNQNHYLNRLITIENMEFDSSQVGIMYAPYIASGNLASSIIMYDCPYTGFITLYNSAYANFQPVITQSGKGTVTGIYSYYNSAQFLIRDSTDIKLTDPRVCN